jgi:tRNA dimethylallyltransferase
VDESVATGPEGHNERRVTPGLPVVVITGATATGKSGLALRLGDALNIEIVSCDSRYLYRGMDVGTAKPTKEELGRIPHHLVDILDPEDDYSLATYLEDAFAAIEDIARRTRVPIVVGGTPLYLRALVEGWTVPRVPPNQQLRQKLEQMPVEQVHDMVVQVDPESAERIGESNKRRLIRAYEVFHDSGEQLSKLEGKVAPPYRLLMLGLFRERDALYRRIDERVRWMFANGLLDEARWLIERGVPDACASLSAIGYREAMAVVRGQMTIEDAVETTCNATHRYVRHQETWFRRFSDIHWLDASDPEVETSAIGLVSTFLERQPSPTG